MKRCLIALGLAAVTAPLFAGTYYEATTTTTADQGGMNARVTAWIDGDSAKVLFEQSDNPFLAEGGYLLSNDGGRTVYFVDPDEGTYMSWDLDAAVGGLGAAMQNLGPMMKMELTNPETKKISDGPGPTLHGLDTTHLVFESSYDMEVKVMGMGQKSHVETRTELWNTTALGDAAFGVWLRNEPPATGIEGLDEMIAQQMEMVQGFPLKSVITSTTTDQKRGRTTTSETVTEVTEFREEAIDPAVFVLDESLERTEMPTLDGMFGNQ